MTATLPLPCWAVSGKRWRHRRVAGRSPRHPLLSACRQTGPRVSGADLIFTAAGWSARDFGDPRSPDADSCATGPSALISPYTPTSPLEHTLSCGSRRCAGCHAGQYQWLRWRNGMGDPAHLAIAGDSAGGHLCPDHHLAAQGCQRPCPRPRCFSIPCWMPARAKAITIRWTTTSSPGTCSQAGFHAYLGNLPLSHPEASPSPHHPARQDYCQSHIVTAEYDRLRDRRGSPSGALVQASMSMPICQRQRGVIHGYFQLAAISPAARRLIDQIAMMLRRL